MDQVFSIFPFFASDYFYIMAIATGYLKSSNKRLFIDLGFLVPFATIVNCTLKSLFLVKRPSIEHHLVPVHDMLGFPSGDVQIAIIFCGLLAIDYKFKSFRIFSMILVTLIGISRIYLGVHSIFDIIGGIGFGVLIILIWKNYKIVNMVDEWIIGKTKSFWLLTSLTLILFMLISKHTETPNVVIASSGALCGFGIFLHYIQNIDMKSLGGQ